jgi:transcriptional regulator with XRE-family HTH domain
MTGIRAAIEQRMMQLDHSQSQVAELTSVPQSDVSRILSGQRKRVTKSVLALCQYANYDVETTYEFSRLERELSQVLRGVIGENPAAAPILTRILKALAPLLTAYHPAEPRTPQDATYEKSSTR